jgi:hypothetical protein
MLNVGRLSYRVAKMHKDVFAKSYAQQRHFPIQVARVGDRVYWHFQDKFYWDNDGLNANEVHALLVTKQQRERQKIDRAQAIVATGLQPTSNNRTYIPDDVKQFVWARDGGRCRNCGQSGELQFDHIIPTSMGGASVAENLQILCGPCNRRKGAGLTLR